MKSAFSRIEIVAKLESIPQVGLHENVQSRDMLYSQ